MDNLPDLRVYVDATGERYVKVGRDKFACLREDGTASIGSGPMGLQEVKDLTRDDVDFRDKIHLAMSPFTCQMCGCKLGSYRSIPYLTKHHLDVTVRWCILCATTNNIRGE